MMHDRDLLRMAHEERRRRADEARREHLVRMAPRRSGDADSAQLVGRIVFGAGSVLAIAVAGQVLLQSASTILQF